jgi:hypothetical protein
LLCRTVCTIASSCGVAAATAALVVVVVVDITVGRPDIPPKRHASLFRSRLLALHTDFSFWTSRRAQVRPFCVIGTLGALLIARDRICRLSLPSVYNKKNREIVWTRTPNSHCRLYVVERLTLFNITTGTTIDTLSFYRVERTFPGAAYTTFHSVRGNFLANAGGDKKKKKSVGTLLL